MHQVDVLLVLGTLLRDEGLPLLTLEGLDGVEVDRVDGSFGAHDGDLGGRERDRRLGAESGSRERVEASSIRLANDDRDPWDRCLGHRGEHLGPVPDDPLRFDLAPDHESGYVGEEQQRDVEGIAQPHEACRLVGGVDEQDTSQVGGLGGDDPDRVPVESGEPGDQLAGISVLDREEAVAIDEATDEVVHVVDVLGVGRDHVCDVDAVIGVHGLVVDGMDPVVVGDVREVLLRPCDRILVRSDHRIADT